MSRLDWPSILPMAADIVRSYAHGLAIAVFRSRWTRSRLTCCADCADALAPWWNNEAYQTVMRREQAERKALAA